MKKFLFAVLFAISFTVSAFEVQVSWTPPATGEVDYTGYTVYWGDGSMVPVQEYVGFYEEDGITLVNGMIIDVPSYKTYSISVSADCATCAVINSPLTDPVNIQITSPSPMPPLGVTATQL